MNDNVEQVAGEHDANRHDAEVDRQEFRLQHFTQKLSGARIIDVRSAQAARMLKKAGFIDVLSAGGIGDMPK